MSEDAHLWVDSDEGVGLGVELLLQRDDHGLEVHHRLVLDVVGHLNQNGYAPIQHVSLNTEYLRFTFGPLHSTHLSDVGVVQSSVDLIQHEEGCRFVADVEEG